MERIELKLIFNKFFEYFLSFGIYRIPNFKSDRKKFRTNSNLTPPLQYHYRPGLHNWECTNVEFKDCSAIQILREINFAHFEAPKTVILTI